MTKGFSYSVVIRTLGTTGDKYLALLNSISRQTVSPEEIIVAIPEGYELDHALGCERIVRAKKGMVSQRAEGILAARSEYILVCDDDIEFNETFCEDLYSWSVKNKLDCCLPMEGPVGYDGASEIALGLPWAKKIRGALTGQVFTSKAQSEFLDKITYSAGHRIYVSSNRTDTCYLAQCGNFQCFFVKTEAAQSVRFQDETWLQEGTMTQYASYDDPTFYYKMFKNGNRIGYYLKNRYAHLDASAGRVSRTKLEEKVIRYYSVARNRSIFWYRLIWRNSLTLTEKMKALAGFLYGTCNYTLYTIIINCPPRYWKAIKAMFRGYYDAYSFLKKTYDS